MEKTINFGLNKPSPNDFYNIEDFNENTVIIDETLKSQEEAIKSTNRNIEKVDAAVKTHDDSIKALEEKCENEIVTTDTTLRNSKAGGIRVIGIDGNSIQNGEPTTDNTQEIVSFGECVEMIQGTRDASNGSFYNATNAITTKYTIPCKENDIIGITTENLYSVYVYYYNENSYVKSSVKYGIKESTFTVPSGVTCVAFTLHNDNINFENVGKITLTVNGKYVIPIKTRGKNLFDVSKYVYTRTLNGLTFTDNNDGTFTLNGTPTEDTQFEFWDCFVENKKGRILSSKLLSGSVLETNNISLSICDSITWAGNYVTLGSEKVNAQSFTANLFRVTIAKGVTCNNARIGVMVRKHGDNTFAPYTEHTEYIYLNEPPRKVGDIADRIVEKDGLFEVERKIGNKVFDGSEDENLVFDTENGVNRLVSNITKDIVKKPLDNAYKANIMCNALCVTKLDYLYSTDYGIAVSTGGLISMKDASFSSLDDWKNYMKNNPIIIDFELETSYFEPLDTESQKALRRLLSYDDVTYIDFDSTIQPSGIEVEYGTSKVGALSLENANLRELLSLGVKDEVNTIHETLKTFNSTLNSIGNEYYSDELLTTSIKAGEILDIVTIDTVTEDVLKGKYMVYVQISGYSATQGSGEIRLFAGTSDIKGCYSVPFQNVGTDLRFNAYISCIVEIKVRYDPVTVKMDTTTDQRITGGHILLVKIA